MKRELVDVRYDHMTEHQALRILMNAMDYIHLYYGPFTQLPYKEAYHILQNAYLHVDHEVD
jgi:hypothetical protein